VAEMRNPDRSHRTPTRLNTTPLSLVFRHPTAVATAMYAIRIIFKYFKAYA